MDNHATDAAGTPKRAARPAAEWLRTTASCTVMLTESEESLERLVQRFSHDHPVFMSICTKDGTTTVIISGENHSQRQLRLNASTNAHMMKSFARYLCRGRPFCRPDEVYAQLDKLKRGCLCVSQRRH